MTAVKVMDIISRLSDDAGQAADAISAHINVKMEDASKLLKIPKSECPDIWIRPPRHKWPTSWTSKFFLLSGICTVILWQDYSGKDNLRKSYCNTIGRRFLIGNTCSYSVKKKDYSYLWIRMASNDRKGTKSRSNVEKKTYERCWFWRMNIFSWSCILGMHSKTMCKEWRYCGQWQSDVWIANFLAGNWKTTILEKSSYFFLILRYGRSCQKMCGTILWVDKQDDSTTPQSIYFMHRWASLQRGRIEICWRIVKSSLSNCPVLGTYCKTTCSWSINKLARAATKWTRACDKRLNRLISYIHHTCEYEQYCHVANTAQQCRMRLFQNSCLVGDLEDSKSSQGKILCTFGSPTFVPSWMCKKYPSVSHSSTESEIISLDTCLHMDEIPALDLWHLDVEMFHSSSNQFQKPNESTRRLVAWHIIK